MKLLLSILTFVVCFNFSYASFPVKRKATVSTEQVKEQHLNQPEMTSPAVYAGKDKWVGVAFLVFLGWPFAAHRWYWGKPVGWNILFILTFAGLGIWAIVDLINLLTDNF